MNELKGFNVRLPRDLWLFLKLEAAKKNTTMVKIVEECLIKLRNKNNKKELTYKNTDV